MTAARLITGADLETAGFNDVADEWAADRGIAGNATTKLNASVVGVAADAANLGSGWGGIITTNPTVKSALLLLETNLESNQVQPVLDLITDMQAEIAALNALVTTPSVITTSSTTVTNTPSVLYVMNSATAQTITLAPDLTNIAVGGVVTILRAGAGSVTIVEGSGVTIRKSSSTLVISAQYKTVQLIKIATNEWVAVGSFN